MQSAQLDKSDCAGYILLRRSRVKALCTATLSAHSRQELKFFLWIDHSFAATLASLHVKSLNPYSRRRRSGKPVMKLSNILVFAIRCEEATSLHILGTKAAELRVEKRQPSSTATDTQTFFNTTCDILNNGIYALGTPFDINYTLPDNPPINVLTPQNRLTLALLWTSATKSVLDAINTYQLVEVDCMFQ